jgi:DNA repair exonuclease SbcCD ATPase subunit
VIIFERISYKNFMSVGNVPMEIELNKHHTVLITADNGAGKSVMLDAICFALFGRAYRSINKPQLLNSINLKQLLVEIEFSIGIRKYRVVRGIKPNIFQIFVDGKLVNEDSSRDYQKVLESNILKMNFRSFTQVGVMGSAAYIPFMKLKTDVRREFIEELLDIRVFSVMKELLSTRNKVVKESLRDVDSSLKSLREVCLVIDGHVKAKTNELTDNIDRIKAECQAALDDNESAQVELVKFNTVLKEAKDGKVGYDKKATLLDEILDAQRRLKKKLQTMRSEIQNFDSLQVCPTCTQHVTDDVKAKFKSSFASAADEYTTALAQLEDKQTRVEGQVEELSGFCEMLTATNTKISELNRRIFGNNLLIDKHNRELTRLNTTPSVDVDRKKLKETAKKIVELDQTRADLVDTQRVNEQALAMLQDNGAKAKVIKQYVPVINKLVNKYLAKLDFFCQFTLDEEFNESVKSRHRDEFSYDSFSQGEKQRIDLALIFTWREIAALKNSVNMNLIIMDEILDAAMDGGGLELCFDLIKDMKKANIFVISHREAISENFDHTIHLMKKNNFTQIAV